MRLHEYLDVPKLKDYINNDIVTRRSHKYWPLDIYCYGRKATYDDIWDDVTCRTRGLIVHRDTNEIIARPFEKFFNLNHLGRPETALEEVMKLPVPPVFSEKLDGSMGTLYMWDGVSAIASKGSFHSEHAEWATKWYHEHMAKTRMFAQAHAPIWPRNHTPMFEMVCQDIQHHVVHYEKDRLILIGLINNESGEELTHGALRMYGDMAGIEVVERHNIDMFQAVMNSRKNAEGYVATWYVSGAPPMKVKIKHEEFLKLQRLRNSTTPKYVYRVLAGLEGQSGDIHWALGASDKFLHDQMEVWLKAYREAYRYCFARASMIVALALRECTERKEFAELFLQEQYREFASVCFKMIDQDDYKPLLWKLVYPVVADQKYTPEEE